MTHERARRGLKAWRGINRPHSGDIKLCVRDLLKLAEEQGMYRAREIAWAMVEEFSKEVKV